MTHPSWRRAMLGLAAACLLAIALALVAQHAFDMQPCPWCILQRLIYLVIAGVALLGALAASALPRRLAAGLVLVLAGCGIAAAVFQHTVAASLASCDLTLADTIITRLGLENAVPWLFQVTSSCADAAVSIAGVPFEYWSLAMYALIAVASLVLVARAGGVPAARG